MYPMIAVDRLRCCLALFKFKLTFAVLAGFVYPNGCGGGLYATRFPNPVVKDLFYRELGVSFSFDQFATDLDLVRHAGFLSRNLHVDQVLLEDWHEYF